MSMFQNFKNLLEIFSEVDLTIFTKYGLKDVFIEMFRYFLFVVVSICMVLYVTKIFEYLMSDFNN